MKVFSEVLNELNEYTMVVDNIKKHNTPIHVTGCVDSQKLHMMYALSKGYKCKVIIAADDIKAKTIADEYKLYDKNVYVYPSKDIIFYTADIHGSAIVEQRMNVIKKLIDNEDCTIVTTIESGMDSVLPLEFILENIVKIAIGDILDLSLLQKQLTKLGYLRVAQVEGKGEFSVRGGIVDIYPLTEEVPIRVEFWDDEVDTIRTFDVESQRSIDNIGEVSIYPASEVILDEETLKLGLEKIEKERKKYVDTLRSEKKIEEAHRIDTIINEFKENLEIYSGSMGIDSYIKYFYNNTMSFFDYFDNKDTIVFMDEPTRINEKGKAIEYEFNEGMLSRLEKGYVLPKQTESIYNYKQVMFKLDKTNLVCFSCMDQKVTHIKVKYKSDITVHSINSYNNNFELLVEDLKKWKNAGYRVLLISSSITRAKRIAKDLFDEGLNAFYSDDFDKIIKEKEIGVYCGNLRQGFEYPMLKYAVISDVDIFGAKKKKRKKKRYSGSNIHNFSELTVGDYVVHENHGIGVYKGIEKIEVDRVEKDYVKIEYADGGNLYVLATGLENIQKYAGADAKKPKINKLNSVEWKKTKTRVKGAVKDIAEELVKLYAIRQAKQGYQFGEDTVWQKEFEEMFPYEETADQLDAIEATKKDMESTKIMDRLICGDVGYGKTEIAIRAAFKAVSDGKQVVFLVPTTILAQQHYNTFTQRMKDFPINIDMLSRFKTPTQQKKTIEKLKSGAIDIVIGTHRVLSKDMGFKKLGLLIVDEEQRFGVTHKEKIKQMKGDVDVLTLSATPIPRTLHMSLVGIRDMSVLEEPPVDRMPIQTYVLEFNEEIVREAINRELARGGQVYFVYNRVNTIDEITGRIAKLVPEANVTFAHGKMSERELERIMYAFINGEIDVLVSTTIVETGLDISNVNTIIIDDADRFGLSQLYQLRGRVGRSNRTAYAFLMYKRNKILREEAEKRLQAIKEFTELGSGFRIAMKDLEIRGAGNLLGAKQHGHMEAVGYDMYCKLLNDAVMELKGEKTEEESFDTAIDMDVDAFIPARYIKSEHQKLDMYKRIADISNDEEHLDIQSEMLDRFGDIPASVNNLLNIAMLKILAHKCFVTQLTQKKTLVKIVMYEKADIIANNIPVLLKEFNGRLKFYPEKEPYFEYTIKVNGKNSSILKPKFVFDSVKEVLEQMEKMLLIVTEKKEK